MKSLFVGRPSSQSTRFINPDLTLRLQATAVLARFSWDRQRQTLRIRSPVEPLKIQWLKECHKLAIWEW